MKRREYMFCSRGEVLERARICDVHLFEATDESSDRKNPMSCRVMDPCRAVRKFTRSGSSDLHKTYEPRSFTQLHATVHYLLGDIWWQSTNQSCNRWNRNLLGKSGSDLGLAYTFVMDRLQAVRQDIISLNIFQSNPFGAIKLLRDIIIFYVNSMHLITSGYGALVASPSPTPGDRQPNATLLYGESYSNGHFQTDDKGTSASPCISISSWFDLHSHESALSSSLTTNLGFCRQLSIEFRDEHSAFDVAAHYDEFSACSMLLCTARQLRDFFQHVHSSTSSSSQNIKAIAAMRLLCVQQPTLGSDSVGTLRESNQYRSNNSTDKLVDKELRPMTELSTSVRTALRCVSCVRRSNPEGAVRAFSSFADTSSTTTTGAIRMKMDCIGAAEVETFHRVQRLLMAALLHHMLPELRQCRLMLCDLSDKKEGVIDLVSAFLSCCINY